MASANPNEDEKNNKDLIHLKEIDLEQMEHAFSKFSIIDVNTAKLYANQNAKHTAIRERLGTSYNVNMRWEAKRLKSFLTCNKMLFWAPMEMASAGLYYTGVEDSVQCFCCGIVLFCKSLTLTPREQHLHFNPSCGFIQGEDVGNIAKYEVRVQNSETGQDSAEAYSTEEARLSSYTNWPFYAKIQPVRLASTGFYFTGRRDIVQCFSCAGCLGHWEENDDPWKEHAKWFPECDFLISKKPPDEIKVLINSYNGFPGFTGKHFLTGVIDSTEPCQPSYTKMSLFQDENVRLESFKKWPTDAKEDTASIARAGFYYTGRGDIVLCISCAGCIYNWEENDDPWKEHVKFIPDCQFLQKTETTPEDQKNPDEEKKEVHMKISNSITNDKFCPVVMELRTSLMELYNKPTFGKSFPFPGSSHVSIDLSLLFADVFFALKSITNRTLNVLTLPEILTDLNDITMIEGEAGSGKTALLRKIAILWASGSCPVLSRFSLVFYISLSSTGSEQTLSDIICQQLIGSSTSLTEDSLAEIIKQFKNQVLFLLDDYGMMDSSPESIDELIKINHWNRVSLAVTVNPDKGRNLRQYARTILNIQDFPTYSSIFIFKNLFSHNLSIVDRITNELISTETLRLVLKCPLFAFCLCVLWVQDPAEKISGDTMVWKSYLMHVMLRHPTEREKINAVVLSCEDLAIESLFKLRFEFTHEDLRESAVDFNDAVKYKILSMFTSQRLRPIFKFFHPSFQEFLAGKRMNELLQSGDATEKERGLFILQSINTISKVRGRFFYFLKYTCMHSPETTAMVISHMFSLLESREVFYGQGDKKDVHLQQHPELKFMDISDNLCKEMDNFKSLINVPGIDLDHDYMIDSILSTTIAIANESNHLPYCVPIILRFLKGKTISVLLSKPNKSLLRFLHRYPEGLSLLERIEIHVPRATMSLNLNFLTRESFRSMWPVPTVDEDYSKAFELSSDLLQRARMPELDYMGVNIDDLSTLGFTADIHRIMSLTVKVFGCPVDSDNILVNIMFFCSLSTQIDLDLNNCPGFLENLWPCIDEYKDTIASLSIAFTKLTIEDQELITHLTALQSLKIVSMPPPEFVLLNIQTFKELKELVVCCPIDDNKWEVIDLLSDEFKSLHNIEKIFFENINMERHASRLASFIEHFHNLISFKMECKYCPGIENIINSLCRNGKMQELRFPELLFYNQEIIHLGSALPSLRNLKILEIEFDYSAKAKPVKAFVEGLACLEHLEEFTFPGGDGVRETIIPFIQTLQHMPKLTNLTIQRRLLNDSSLLELAKIIAAGHLRNLQKLDLDNNLHITQSGWRDFFLLLDNLPKLTVLNISRSISDQYVTDPVTFIALTQCVSRLHSLEILSILGWLLDDKDIEMFDSMKMKHPQSKGLTLFWKWTLPFSPVFTK